MMDYFGLPFEYARIHISRNPDIVGLYTDDISKFKEYMRRIQIREFP